MTACGETITLNECETFYGLIESTQDALIIFEACNLGILRRVKRRLGDEERKLCVRPGAVFVYDENESGIKRWTDGREWSPSRILGNFLVYRELEKKISRREGGGPGASGIPPELCGLDLQVLGSTKGTFVFKHDGLIKKTISAVMNGSMHHLVCYCTKSISPNLRLYPPGAYQELSGIHIRQDLIAAQNFRRPLKIIRYGENGLPERRSISTRGSNEEDESFIQDDVTLGRSVFQSGHNASVTPPTSGTTTVTFGSGMDLPDEDFSLTELTSLNECGGLNIHDIEATDLGAKAFDLNAEACFADIHPSLADAVTDVHWGNGNAARHGWEAGSALYPMPLPFATASNVRRAPGFATSRAMTEEQRTMAAFDGGGIYLPGNLEFSLGQQPGTDASNLPSATAAPAGLKWHNLGPENIWQENGGHPAVVNGRGLLPGRDSAVDLAYLDSNGFETGALGFRVDCEPSEEFVELGDHDLLLQSVFDSDIPHDALTSLWAVSEG